MAEAFPVSGNIEPASFPHLLVDLHRHGATGSLKVTGPVENPSVNLNAEKLTESGLPKTLEKGFTSFFKNLFRGR